MLTDVFQQAVIMQLPNLKMDFLSVIRIRKTPDGTQYFHLITTIIKIFPIYEIVQLQKDHLSESKERGKLIAEYHLMNQIHSN